MALGRRPTEGRRDPHGPSGERGDLPLQVSMGACDNALGGSTAPVGTGPVGTGPVGTGPIGAAESDPARTCTVLTTLRLSGTAPAAVTKACPSGKHAARAELRLSSSSENTSSKSNTGLDPS